MPDTPATADARKSAAGPAERKKKKNLNAAAIGRRMTSIKGMQDKDKAKKGRRRLLNGLLSGIADGSVKDPAKAAQAFLTHSKGKGAAKADDE